MTVEFEHVTLIDAPIEIVFDVSLDIDAHLASMSDSNERAIDGVTTGHIGLGESVTWRARHFGIPFTMTSRVIELDRPRRFVDEQMRGPVVPPRAPLRRRRRWHDDDRPHPVRRADQLRRLDRRTTRARALPAPADCTAQRVPERHGRGAPLMAPTDHRTLSALVDGAASKKLHATPCHRITRRSR